jgi:hypothetical protein
MRQWRYIKQMKFRELQMSANQRTIHNKNINDRQQSWLDAQKAARPLYWRYKANRD